LLVLLAFAAEGLMIFVGYHNTVLRIDISLGLGNQIECHDFDLTSVNRKQPGNI